MENELKEVKLNLEEIEEKINCSVKEVATLKFVKAGKQNVISKMVKAKQVEELKLVTG